MAKKSNYTKRGKIRKPKRGAVLLSAPGDFNVGDKITFERDPHIYIVRKVYVHER